MPANSRNPGRRTRAVALTVKVMRLARGLSVESLADEADIRPHTLRKLETGNKAIDVEQLDRIAGAFGRSLEEITGISAMPDDQPLDVKARADLAAKAIDLVGAPPETIHRPLIDRLLKRPLTDI